MILISLILWLTLQPIHMVIWHWAKKGIGARYEPSETDETIYVVGAILICSLWLFS